MLTPFNPYAAGKAVETISLYGLPCGICGLPAIEMRFNSNRVIQIIHAKFPYKECRTWAMKD